MLTKIKKFISSLDENTVPLHLRSEDELQLLYKRRAKANLSGFLILMLAAVGLKVGAIYDPALSNSLVPTDIINKMLLVFMVLNITNLSSFFSSYASIKDKTIYDKIPLFSAIKYSCVNAPWNVSSLAFGALFIFTLPYLMSGTLLPMHFTLPLGEPTTESATIAIFSITYPIVLFIASLAMLSVTPLDVRIKEQAKESDIVVSGVNLKLKPSQLKSICVLPIILTVLTLSFKLFATKMENTDELRTPSITVELNGAQETYEVGGLTGITRSIGEGKEFNNYAAGWLGSPLSALLTSANLKHTDIIDNPKALEAIAAMNLNSIKLLEAKFNQETLTYSEKVILDSFEYQFARKAFERGFETDKELLGYLVQSDMDSFIEAFESKADDIIVTLEEVKASDDEVVSLAPTSEHLARIIQKAGIHDFGFIMHHKDEGEHKPRPDSIKKLVHTYEMLSKGKIVK